VSKAREKGNILANEQNLIPFSELPKDRHRELSQRGGLASGAARRRKREARTKLGQTGEREVLRPAHLAVANDH